MARRRGLTPEDLELWRRVAATTRAAHKPAPTPERPAPRIAPPEPSGAEPFKPSRFRIGQTAATPPPRLDTAPSPAQRLAAVPPRMDAKLHRRMSRGKLAPEARIDLHGLTLNAAQPALENFILRAHAAGLRLVLVITGKGKAGGPDAPLPVRPGALRHHVPLWLHRPPLNRLVLQVTPAHYRHGGEGAYYVYLRK